MFKKDNGVYEKLKEGSKNGLSIFLLGIGVGLILSGLLLLIFRFSPHPVDIKPGDGPGVLKNAEGLIEDGVFSLASYLPENNLLNLARRPITITINPGDTALVVARKLDEAGLVSGKNFLKLVTLTGWDRDIRFGTYYFSPRQSEIDIFLTICNH